MSRTKLQMRAAKKLLKKPRGPFEQLDLDSIDSPDWMTRAFRNNRYVVMINDNAEMTNGIIAIRAMVQRHDDKPIPNHWREMQSIKNEIFGSDRTGIEFYPAESELQNYHNIYWLWILPEGTLPKAV